MATKVQEEVKFDIEAIRAEVRRKVEAAVMETAGRVDVAAVKDEILADLKKSRDQVVWVLLGLDNKWGKFEVDHCNGRESAITRYLVESCREEIQAWCAMAVREVLEESKVKMRADIRAAVKKEVLQLGDNYRYQANISDAVANYAHAFVDEELKAIVGESGLPIKEKRQ